MRLKFKNYKIKKHIKMLASENKHKLVAYCLRVKYDIVNLKQPCTFNTI